MALDTFKCNYLTPLHFKGLSNGILKNKCLKTLLNNL